MLTTAQIRCCTPVAISQPLPVVDSDLVRTAFASPTDALSLSRWGFVTVLDHTFHLFLPSRRGVSTAGNKGVFAAGVFLSYADARNARDDAVLRVAVDTVNKGAQWGPGFGLKIWHSVLCVSHEHTPGCCCCFCDQVFAILADCGAQTEPPYDDTCRRGSIHFTTQHLPSVEATLQALIY